MVLFQGADDGDTQAYAIEAMAGNALNVLGSDVENPPLDLGRIEDFAVAEEAFAHPHDLVGSRLKAHECLADGIILGLS